MTIRNNHSLDAADRAESELLFVARSFCNAAVICLRKMGAPDDLKRKREPMTREVTMTGSSIKASIVAVSAAALLAACADPAVPAYTYYSGPCPPTAAAGATPQPATSASTSTATPAPPTDAPGAQVTSPATTASCIIAVPTNGYAAQYPYYWDYGGPYDDGFGFGAFVGGDFDHRFHDHDFDRRFHGHDFHGAFHDHDFHGGGLHAGGFHGGGFHGGGHGGRG